MGSCRLAPALYADGDRLRRTPQVKSHSVIRHDAAGELMTTAHEGGCCCGAVRFSVAEIYDSGYCYCSICRKMSGAPAVAWAVLPSQAFRLLSGVPRRYRSSENWVRYFCGDCGGPVYQQTPDSPEDGADLLCVLIPCLDDPEAVRPAAHMWCSARLSWFEISDRLPRFEDGTMTDPATRVPSRAV